MLNKVFIVFLLATLSIMLTACGESDGRYYNDPDSSTDVNDLELEEFNLALISFEGQVLNESGQGIPSVEISFAGVSVVTDELGRFQANDITRENRLLEFTHQDYYTEQVVLQLQVDSSISLVSIPPIYLSSKNASLTRMLFGGDVSFGRRFIDPDNLASNNELPSDSANAFIQVSTPEQGTRDVLQWIRPYFQAADWRVLNLETPVIDNPSTPHPEKDFLFFTLPGSLAGLSWLGVDYVSLGNNHIYDYLDLGVVDTINNLDQYGLAHSGAGLNSDAALVSYRDTLNGTDYSFFSASSVKGSQHQISYVAEADKGGSADLTLDQPVYDAIDQEKSLGRSVVAQLHTGTEYTYEPTSYVQGRMQLVVDAGADLVVTHHPHVAQGVGILDETPIIHGLGNLVFDQDRQETLLGLLARVDMAGESVERIRLLPVYLEDYRPRLIAGSLASQFLRRISEFSHGYGLFVYPYLGQAWVANSREEVNQSIREVIWEVSLSDSGEAIIDLRQLQMGNESLERISTSANVSYKLGRDLMLYGDFEDYDTDNQKMEAARWNLDGLSNYTCLDNVYRGAVALCNERSYAHQSDSLVEYRNRIRVMGNALDVPEKDLTLFAYVRRDNSGAIEIKVDYLASTGDRTFGQETLTLTGGDSDWEPVLMHLSLPDDSEETLNGNLGDANARAVKVSLRHSPPRDGKGIAMFDDIAMISWNGYEGGVIETPHAQDFLYISGTPGERVSLTLSFIQYFPDY